MLVLSRRDGQGVTFKIDDETIVTLKVKLDGNRVSLVIDADEVIRVVRTELLEREERIPDVA